MHDALLDPEVEQALDDLFASIDAPTAELLRSIWPYHEETPPWLALSLFRKFVKTYNDARTTGVTDDSGNRFTLDPGLALRYSLTVAGNNSTLQTLFANAMTEAGNRRLNEDG